MSNPKRRVCRSKVKYRRESFVVKGIWSSIGDPKNLPRVILVVGNAAIADTPLCHDRVETRIGDGISTAAAGRLRAVDEGVDSSVAAVFLLNLTVPPTAQQEKDTSDNGGHDNDGDHNTGGNTSGVRSLVFTGRLGSSNGDGSP